MAIFTGEDIAKDKVGGLICGWMIHSKDGSPMKAGAHPALATGKVRYVGDHVAVVIADTYTQARDAAEKIVVDYGVLPAVTDTATAAAPGAAQIHDVASNNMIYDWHLGDKTATEAAFAAAAHVTKIDLVNNRLVPNPMEPRAAVGEYDSGTDTLTLYTTSQNPHVARVVLSAFIGIAPENKLRVIAPDVGGGFGSKIFIYAEETVCVWAARKIDRPVKWTSDRTEAFLCDAHGRDHVTHAELAVDASGKITGLRVHTIANIGAYMSTFSSAVPTYLYALLLSGQYNIPNIYAEVDAVYTNTAPVDAYRGAGRPEATFVVERLVEVAARELGRDPAEFRRANFITAFPHQTPVIVNYDTGNYGATLDKALELADYKGIGGAQGGLGGEGQAARDRLFRLYRGVRARALAGHRQLGRRGRRLGIGGSARQHGWHRRSSDGLAQPRSGSRDDLRATGFGAARNTDRKREHRPWRHRQGADGHGHLRLALGRRRRDGDFQSARQGRGQGEEDRRLCARGVGKRHRVEGRQVHREGNRQVDRLRLARVGGLYPRISFPGARSNRG